MADETSKQGPASTPTKPGDLAARVGPAGTAPGHPAGIRIRLEVRGGLSGERYELRFELDETGETTAALLDQIRKVEIPPRLGKVSRDDFLRVLRETDLSRMAELARTRRPIPPDSLIGRLTIGDGEQEVRAVFMADRGQADAAGWRADPGLQQVLDTLYRLAARQLGVKDVRS